MNLSLQIEAARTTVTAARPDPAGTALILELGWRSLAERHFRHNPPRSADLERAIEAVEDELARTKAACPGGTLTSSDAALREIALRVGTTTVTREAVEQLFQELAAGRPGLPDDAAFAPALLILRELMHHLDFPSLQIAS